MGDSLCLNLLLPTRGITQFINFNFTSACTFEGKALASNENGIFLLESSELDDGVEILSLTELARTDFGISNEKRVRKVWVGYQSLGELLFLVSADGGDWEEFTMPENQGELNQKGAEFTLPRSMHGRYWQFAIQNPNGVDFSIDQIQVMLVVLNKRPRRG
jgi:hypothetical protein